jgi:hypothetical protein
MKKKNGRETEQRPFSHPFLASLERGHKRVSAIAQAIGHHLSLGAISVESQRQAHDLEGGRAEIKTLISKGARIPIELISIIENDEPGWATEAPDSTTYSFEEDPKYAADPECIRWLLTTGSVVRELAESFRQDATEEFRCRDCGRIFQLKWRKELPLGRVSLQHSIDERSGREWHSLCAFVDGIRVTHARRGKTNLTGDLFTQGCW